MIDDPARDAGEGRRARKAELLVRGEAKRGQTMRVLGDGGEEAGRRRRGAVGRWSRTRAQASPARRAAFSVAPVPLVCLAAASPSPCAAQALGRRLADRLTVWAPRASDSSSAAHRFLPAKSHDTDVRFLPGDIESHPLPGN
jgi:hypothetical protein